MRIKWTCRKCQSVSLLLITTSAMCCFYVLTGVRPDAGQYATQNYNVYNQGGDQRRRLTGIKSSRDITVYSRDAKLLSAETKSIVPPRSAKQLPLTGQVQYSVIKHSVYGYMTTGRSYSLHDRASSSQNIDTINNLPHKTDDFPRNATKKVMFSALNQSTSPMEINETTNTEEKVKRRLPQVIIIGVKKCGTRALLEYLRIHPDIRATGPEPHFFDRYYHLGLDWYRRKMPRSLEGQVTIEKTPRYFVTLDVPERLYNMSRDIKLIIIIRNPVTRAISDFTQAASKGHEPMTVTFRSKAFRKNGSEVNTHWSPITTGLYAKHLRRWLKYFPLQNIHFVSGENLISNPSIEMDQVQDFLGIQRVVTAKHFYFNKTKGFPCLRKYPGSLQARCFNTAKGRHHSYVDHVTLSRLSDFYEPYNNDFYELTGRHFGW